MLFSRYVRARKYHKTLSCNFCGVYVSLVHSLTLLQVLTNHCFRFVPENVTLFICVGINCANIEDSFVNLMRHGCISVEDAFAVVEDAYLVCFPSLLLYYFMIARSTLHCDVSLLTLYQRTYIIRMPT